MIMGMNENLDDKWKEENMNPSDRLGYLYSIAKFHKSMGKNITMSDLESFVDKVIDLTKKYKDLL